MRNSLGLGNTLGVLQPANGGTGYTSLETMLMAKGATYVTLNLATSTPCTVSVANNSTGCGIIPFDSAVPNNPFFEKRNGAIYIKSTGVYQISGYANLSMTKSGAGSTTIKLGAWNTVDYSTTYTGSRFLGVGATAAESVSLTTESTASVPTITAGVAGCVYTMPAGTYMGLFWDKSSSSGLVNLSINSINGSISICRL